MDYFSAPGKEEFEEFLKDVHSMKVAGGEKSVWSQDSPRYVSFCHKLSVYFISLVLFLITDLHLLILH